jgi:hypothetical protein
MQVETWFFVAIQSDGQFQAHTKMPEEPIEAVRQATAKDIFDVCETIARNHEQQVLVDKIVEAVVNKIQPTPQPVSSRIAARLKERGLEPDSGDSTP